MDIANISPIATVWPVSTLERGTDCGTSMTSCGNGGTQTQPRDAAAAGVSASRPPPDPDTPTGPPPAFSTTPLELESNLQILLARLNASGYAQMQAMGSEDGRSTGEKTTGDNAGQSLVAPASILPESSTTGLQKSQADSSEEGSGYSVRSQATDRQSGQDSAATSAPESGTGPATRQELVGDTAGPPTA